MFTEIAAIAAKAAKAVEAVAEVAKDIPDSFKDIARPSSNKGFELPKSYDFNSKCDVKPNDSIRPKDFSSDFSNMSIKPESPEKIKCRNEELAGKNHPETGVLFEKRTVDVNGKKTEVVSPNPENFNSDKRISNLSFEERMRIVDAREAEPEKLGGSYKEVYRFGEGENTEVHHMPADSISELPRSDGPAIRMEKADHRMTASCGNSMEAREYRAEQKRLIDEGKFREALQMDIDDIHDKFGDKYDKGISQMKDYVDSLEKEGKI